MENNKKKIIIKKKSETSSDKSQDNNEINNIEEDTTNTNETNKNEETKKGDVEDFGKLFEESIAEEENEIHANQVVTGKIVEIRPDVVFVDLGYKSEGIVERSEFDEEPEIGNEIDVFVVIKENQDGELILSKNRADLIKTKERIEASYDEDTTIKGRIEKEIKGGFIVNIGGTTEAFLPFSQVDIQKNIQASDYLDKTFEFKIIKYEPGKNANIVLSRRVLLEEKYEKEKEEFFKKLSIGDEVEGNIKTILDYGIFINLGAIDGFIHVSDLSWEHINKPSKHFNAGEKVKAKVLEINEEGGKVNLGIKQLTEDPWKIFIKEYKKGDVVKGKVVKISDYGAFIKIFQGVEGLLHISEMSWTKRLRHPKEVLKEGQQTEVQILDIEPENKKLSLGLRQVLPNPWDNLNEILPIGKKVTGKVKNIVKTGMFVDLVEGIEGFLPQSEVDWVNKRVNMRRDYKRNDSIDVVILETDTKNKRIIVGRKQLEENPYQAYIEKHSNSDFVTGKVTKIADFGAFVRLDRNIEGMIPKSHVSKKRIDNIEDVLKVGDEVKCAILDTDLKNNKIKLSIKNFERRQERREIEKYTVKNEKEASPKVTLGDLIDLSKLKEDEEETN